MQCPVCQRKYGSETALKNHKKIKHGRTIQDHNNVS